MKQKIRKKTSVKSNHFQTIALLISMAGLLGLIGWLVAGVSGVKIAVILTTLTVVFTPKMPPRLVMKSFRAKPLNPRTLGGLYKIAGQLAQNAGLEKIPALYYLPSPKLNAFAVGNKKDSAIALTHGLITALTTRELAGILAHEITHIKNNDTQVMALSSVFGRMTNYLSLAGQILLVFSLPLVIAGKTTLSLLALGVMVFAPVFSMLLYLALSRTREFEADKGSLILLNDPRALASALSKVEQYNTGAWRRFFAPIQVRPDQAPLLLSHPPTKERVRRLLAMSPKQKYHPGYRMIRPDRQVIVL
ncbi:MAG: zinc metalloprotease HtpX [Desulfobacterales bacterium]|nr:zinc metalloprotease HtpX [Desulfobacterales bacterium]